MENKKLLEIYIEIEEGYKLNDKIGHLFLPKATTLHCYVKSYYFEQKEINDKKAELERKKTKLDLDLLDKKEELRKLGNQRLQEGGKWKERVTVKGKEVPFAQVNYDENLKQADRNHNEKIKEIDNQIEELENELIQKKQKYKGVRWIAQLMGSGRPILNKDSFNEKHDIGKPAVTIEFEEFIVGGGAIYIEPYWDGEIPKNKYPNGLIVNAPNGEHKIIGADWRDQNNELIKGPIKFGSTVFLNIYTKAMYGQTLKIHLKDKDDILRYLTFTITNADDTLEAIEYTKNDTEIDKRDEDDIDKKSNFFKRSVNVHKAKSKPDLAIKGNLIENDENKTDKKITSIPFIQKCKFSVYIDPAWQHTAGEELEIYPIVQTKKINNNEEIPVMNSLLFVSSESSNLISVSDITSNMVVVTGEIETNMNTFHLCGYNQLAAIYNNEDILFFSKTESEDEQNLVLQLIANDEDKSLFINAPDLETQECEYNNIEGYHTNHFITIESPEKFKNLSLDNNTVFYDISYPKPSSFEMVNYNLFNYLKPITNNIDFETCRFLHKLQIDIYPEFEYSFNAHLGVDEDKYLFIRQTKKYHKRKYKAKGDSEKKRVKKAYNEKRKQDYQNQVDEKITKDNIISEYEFSVEYEVKWADEDSISVGAKIATIEDVIENIIYVYSIVDSYLGGSKMEQAEKDPEQAAEFKKSEKDRKEKKSSLKKSKLPLKFTISPPKFTGGVAWKYAQSEKNRNQNGIVYEFKLGALPLVGFEGRLDLLFGAKFIPWLGQVVSALDKVVDAINTSGEIMKTFGVGNMEADYYFDLVITADFNIDVVKGLQYHTKDGLKAGDVSVYSEMSIGLEAGGYIKVEVFDIKGEGAIHAEAKANFSLTWNANKPKILVFGFDGIEALIYTKINMEKKGKKDNEKNEQKDEGVNNNLPIVPTEVKKQKEGDLNEVEIFKPFKVEIQLFD